MIFEKDWEEIADWLSEERSFSSKRGSKFHACFAKDAGEIVFIPLESGIERRVSRAEWGRFMQRYNKVKVAGYDPLRAGHYARITFNASYLVAILLEFETEKNLADEAKDVSSTN